MIHEKRQVIFAQRIENPLQECYHPIYLNEAYIHLGVCQLSFLHDR